MQWKSVCGPPETYIDSLRQETKMSAPCGPQYGPDSTPEYPAHGPQTPHVCIGWAAESHMTATGPRDAEAVVVALLQEQNWDDSSMIVGSAHFEDNVHTCGGSIPIYDKTTNQIGRVRSRRGGVEMCAFVERNEFDATVLDGLVHITKKESANDCHIRRAAHARLPPFGAHTSWSWHALAVGVSQTLHHGDQIRLSVPNSAYNSSIVFQLKRFEQGICKLPPPLIRRASSGGKHTC